MAFAIIEADSGGWCKEFCGRNPRIWEVGGVLVDRLSLVSRRDIEMTGEVGTKERTCGSSTGPRRISGRTNWSRPSELCGRNDNEDREREPSRAASNKKKDIGTDEILELEAEMHQLLNSRGTSRV